MITGIRGLCNGLGPALYGFVFYLFHVELSDTDGSEKGAKVNMANPTDEVSPAPPRRHTCPCLRPDALCSLLLRAPSSRAPPSCSAPAPCCCPCWWRSSSPSTRGPACGRGPTRSTATGRRATPTAPRAAGRRARSRCWRTAAYSPAPHADAGRRRTELLRSVSTAQGGVLVPQRGVLERLHPPTPLRT